MAEAGKVEKSLYPTAAVTIRAINVKTSTQSFSLTLFLSPTSHKRLFKHNQIIIENKIKPSSLLLLPSEVPYEDYWAVTHSHCFQDVLKKNLGVFPERATVHPATAHKPESS